MSEEEIEEIRQWVGWWDNGKPMKQVKVQKERLKFWYEMIGIAWTSWGRPDTIMEVRRKKVKKYGRELR